MVNPASPRYSRQVLLKEWGSEAQTALARTPFVVIGAGGVGSPALLTLVESGAGSVTVIDADTVEETNLPRQSLHTPARLGMNKAESAKLALSEIDPSVPVTAVTAWADEALLATLLMPETILIDASDNSKTRHMTNRAARDAHCRLVSASAVRFRCRHRHGRKRCRRRSPQNGSRDPGSRQQTPHRRYAFDEV